jgi:mannose-6-phosphate isomerase-like protein (cupin superfamily)
MSIAVPPGRASPPGAREGTDARPLNPPGWSRIETVVECTDLDAMVEWFTTEVGLRIETISPADDPGVYVLTGSGIAVRVVRADHDRPVALAARVPATLAGPTLRAPNGTTLELVDDGLTTALPDNRPSFSLVRAGDGFGFGRAGMEYRDLLPDRAGGRFIASHIRIAGGGEVADSVHFHRIRFQMIFCARGWVDLVYEDQGEPFRLEAGDCVLQPPEIRHRVLRSSPGLEVIEIGCPAVHDTFIEHSMELPTATFEPTREFGGQRFVRHVASDAARPPWLIDGLTVRDTGIAHATAGLAGAVVIAAAARNAPITMLGSGAGAATGLRHGSEFVLDVVIEGSADLALDDGSHRWTEHVGPRDAIAFPSHVSWGWSAWSDDFEVLEVSLPADAVDVGGGAPH